VIRITRRGFGLLGGAVLLFLLGTNLQSGWLFALSSLLLGTSVAGALIPLSMVRVLSVERRAPAEAFVGDQVPVDLAIENRSRRTMVGITVRDSHIAPASAFLDTIRPGERVTVQTVRRAQRRGVQDAAPVEVASTTPFGVAEARRRLSDPGRVVIFPRVVPLEPLQFLEGPSVRPLGHGARAGEGQEFIGVREYRYGDSRRNVHWPSTARRGALVVREMEREHQARLAVLVDTHTDGGAGETALDVCCTVAASVAVAALSRGHDVLVGAARQGQAPAPAPVGRREALTWLAELAAPGGLPLAAVIERAVPHVGGSAILIVAPTWQLNTGAALQGQVAALAAGAASVIAVLVDASAHAGAGEALAPPQVRDLERALAAAGAAVRLVRYVDDLGPGLGRPAGPAALGGW
jgi:uncharacterized protein (DUF58 family)